MTAIDEYIRAPVIDFMYHMERRLRMNEDKTSWAQDDPRDLFMKSLSNMGQLGHLLSYQWPTNPDEIAIRCANAANYLMMIHDRAKTQYAAQRGTTTNGTAKQ